MKKNISQKEILIGFVDFLNEVLFWTKQELTPLFSALQVLYTDRLLNSDFPNYQKTFFCLFVDLSVSAWMSILDNQLSSSSTLCKEAEGEEAAKNYYDFPIAL